MSEPSQPPIHMERYYRLDAEYTADTANMEAAGWRLVTVRREPDNTIVATYAYGALNEQLPGAPYPHYSAFQTERRYTRLAFGLAIALPVLIVSLCVGVVIMSVGFITLGSLSGCTTGSASCSNSSDTQPSLCVTATPATTPTSTDTSKAKLGGVYDAFGALFGCEGSSGWYDVSFHGQIVTIEVWDSQSGATPGLASKDGLDRVYAITVSWYHYPVPDLASRRALVAHFFPPDSVSRGANTKVSPTEYLYHSATLEALFVPDSFVNSSYQIVAPGTFSEVCDAARCTVQLGDWDWV